MVFADEMKAAGTMGPAWLERQPFVYGVAGHNPNTAGLDPGGPRPAAVLPAVFESSRVRGAAHRAHLPPAR